jgi:uncharacterized OB-fold protein
MQELEPMTFDAFKDLLPDVTDLNAPFWEGLAAGELRLQQCNTCDARQHPSESFCYACGAQDIAWRPVSGGGEIYSFITVHQLYHAAFKDHLPYVVAIVQLDEGSRILGAMFDLKAEPAIGSRVRAAFQAIDDESAFLLFELAD